MTISEAWDRLFWAIMIVIFVGLVWIGLLEDAIGPCDGPGLIVALAVGIAFFYDGWRRAKKDSKTSDEETLKEDH